jgi:hypothetical protein
MIMSTPGDLPPITSHELLICKRESQAVKKIKGSEEFQKRGALPLVFLKKLAPLR